MSIIRVLPENVASQIAAGEVVDRPASVVRELIDNSLDSGADRIMIRIENGGKGLIRVSDNGLGMVRDDLLLCIERHATSKIQSASDLFAVKSLGFRGEAIPSIASVSRMQITSRPKEQLEGYRLKISGGKLNAIDETGAPAGTTIEVRDLFFNLPARRKFLRSPKTEINHIMDTLTRMVLPYPAVSFKLEDAGKTLMNFPPSEQLQPRLYSLMGRDIAEAMVEAEAAVDEMSIQAWLAPPDLNRSRGDRLFVYLNGRYIRDRLVTRAVMEGYGQRLMKGRYPQAAVFIELDPSQVDVNVHPTKQEVRFHDNRLVFDTLVSTIRRSLSKSFQVFTATQAHHPMISEPLQQSNFSFGTEPMSAVPFIPRKNPAQDLPVTYIPPDPHAEAETQSMPLESPQVIGQLGGTYILCEAKDGLVMVDQHAAHERIVYETLKKGVQTSHVEIQALLIPHELEFSVKESRIAIEKKMSLANMGFDLDHFGGNTFLLRSHPAILNHVNWNVFFPEVLSSLRQGKSEDEAVLDQLLTVMACHGAIRAGYHMSFEEMEYLIHQLATTALPTNCPHGRPVFRRLGYYEIEKMFKRVV